MDEKFTENANTDATRISEITASAILIPLVVYMPPVIFVPFVTVTFSYSKD